MSITQELRLNRLLKEREEIHIKISDIKEKLRSNIPGTTLNSLKLARARLKSLSNNIENLRYQIRKSKNKAVKNTIL